MTSLVLIPECLSTKNSVTAFRMILAAYHLQDFQLFGGPEWINSEWFALEAKAADSSTDESRLRLMLRALMRERFQLASMYNLNGPTQMRFTARWPVYASGGGLSGNMR